MWRKREAINKSSHVRQRSLLVAGQRAKGAQYDPPALPAVLWMLWCLFRTGSPFRWEDEEYPRELDLRPRPRLHERARSVLPAACFHGRWATGNVLGLAVPFISRSSSLCAQRFSPLSAEMLLVSAFADGEGTG